jgi:NodT family efflux transporter outer membrane factor (OMF) lipoprotein
MRCPGLVFSSATILLSALLTSCMMGPDFHPPAAPPTMHYTEKPTPTKTASIPKSHGGGESQHFLAGKEIPGQWWYLFHSTGINQLIETGLKNSPNLVAAKATLVQAQQNLQAQIGASYFPQVSLALSAERERFNPSAFGAQPTATSGLFDLYNAGVNVSYTLDIFGALRRQVESLYAQVDYEQYELSAAYLTLTSNIVTTSIAVASYQAQIAATKDIIQSLQRQLNIMRKQFKLGGISGADVASQESQLAATEATLPPLQQALAASHHALAVLVGVLPSDFVMPPIELAQLKLPVKLPVSLPSQLVRQRPDVQAAEALMDSANAQVGVATANLFPQLPLTAAFGYESLSPSTLFLNTSTVWSVIGNLTQPVFNGGELTAKRRAAVAAYQTAFAQYRQTVLQAFQNVADSLRALEHDALALRAQRDNELAARQSLNITQQQYSLGGVNYTTLLVAEKQYQQAVIGRVQAQASRYSDTAALFQALGGGWWNNRNAIAAIKPELA